MGSGRRYIPDVHKHLSAELNAKLQRTHKKIYAKLLGQDGAEEPAAGIGVATGSTGGGAKVLGVPPKKHTSSLARWCMQRYREAHTCMLAAKLVHREGGGS